MVLTQGNDISTDQILTKKDYISTNQILTTKKKNNISTNQIMTKQKLYFRFVFVPGSFYTISNKLF